MSLIAKQQCIATYYHNCQLRLLRIFVTLREISESRIVFKRIKWMLKIFLKIFERIFRTLYWLLAPNMLFKLAIRHMVLFSIMFAIPPTIRLTIKPLWRFVRNRIILPLVMGREWVNKYLSIKRQCYGESITYEEYAKYGMELDEMEGYNSWRMKKTSKFYSYDTIHQDLFKLVNIKQRCADCANITRSAAYPLIRNLMEFVKSRIERNYCGINNAQLYSVATIGTKQLIEDFIDNMCKSLQFIANFDDDAICLADKIIYFKELRHVLGRSALCLSGGGGLGYYHTGVITAMAQNNLLPKIITGASSGSFLAAFACCKCDHELNDISKYKHVNMKIYKEKEHRTWFTVFSVRCVRFWKTGYFLDAKVLSKYSRDNLGDITFLEAYEKTGRILNISVSGSGRQNMPRLLNFLSAPDVVIWSAVTASCSIPIVFEPQQLYIKSENKLEPIYLEGIKFSDGSLTHDLPMNKIATLFNVDNFIVSQVNPHIVPFLFHSIIAPLPLFHKLFTFLAKQFHLYLSTILVNIGGVTIINDLLTQKWTGDVTIVPDVPIRDFIDVLKNPTMNYVERVCKSGAKSTFKHISRLEALCAVEFTIDQCLKDVREQYREHKLNKSDAESFNKLSRIASFQTPTNKPKSFDFHVQDNCESIFI